MISAVEGERMSALVNQLVTLSRMDEEESNLVVSRFDLSSAAEDMVSEFCSLAAEREKELSFQLNLIFSIKETRG